MKLPAWASRQVGPFPVGVWLLIIAAGVGIGVIINRKLGAAPEEVPELVEDDVGPDPYSAGFGAAPPGYAGPVGLSPAPSSGGEQSSTPPAIYDNDTWLSVASAGLAERRPEWQPLVILEALQTYLASQSLTAAQRAMVNAAILEYGPPPFPPSLTGGSVPSAPPPSSGGGGSTPSPTSDGGASAAERTVTRAYRDLLNRDPDAAGLRYWSGKVKAGMTDTQLRANIRRTDEYRRLAIKRAYRDFLGRSPKSGEVSYWLGEMKSKNASEQTMRQWIAATPEANK